MRATKQRSPGEGLNQFQRRGKPDAALAYERGELEGQVEVYNIPPAVDVRKVREKIGLSQAEFANHFGFNRRSLQDWEQGRRMPDSAARAYLLVIASNPRAVSKALFRKAS